MHVTLTRTSGQDSSGKNSEEYHALKAQIRALEKPVIVHSLAFTSSHDFDFLNNIRRDLGTSEGGFQYAEPGDGAGVLKQKMQAIFEAVSYRVPSLEFTVSLDGFVFLNEVLCYPHNLESANARILTFMTILSQDEMSTSPSLQYKTTLSPEGVVELIAFVKKDSSAHSYR